MVRYSRARRFVSTIIVVRIVDRWRHPNNSNEPRRFRPHAARRDVPGFRQHASVSGQLSSREPSYLRRFGQVVRRRRLIPPRLVHQLRGWLDKHPKRVAEIFSEAIALREIDLPRLPRYRVGRKSRRRRSGSAQPRAPRRAVAHDYPAQQPKVLDGRSRNRNLQQARSSRRCCGRREICSWVLS